MKTKHKIAIISIIAVLVLSVIGMAIGLVLVAQQANISNSMTISYQATNVDATITTNAKLFKADGSTNDIELKDSTDTTGSVEFDAKDSEADGGFDYKHVDLNAGDYVEYYFTITNTATPVRGEDFWYEGSTETNYLYYDESRELKVKANVTGYADNDNIKISVGKAKTDYLFHPDSTTSIEAIDNLETDSYTGKHGTVTTSFMAEKLSEFEKIGARDILTLTVRMEIDDPTLDANLEAGFNIQLGYEDIVADPTPTSSLLLSSESDFWGYYDTFLQIQCDMDKVVGGVTTHIDTQKFYMSGGTEVPSDIFGYVYNNSNFGYFAPISMKANEKVVFTFLYTDYKIIEPNHIDLWLVETPDNFTSTRTVITNDGTEGFKVEFTCTSDADLVGAKIRVGDTH